MEDKKPLIFLNPLSESLTKLKEVMSQSAEDDGIEIFEAESVEEMAQLLPNIGQSVVLTSNPKKCAMMLQSSRNIIKAQQSKVILLSPKVIPYRTLEKFMKIGLTECIVEPVAPKTLLYKVNLFVRSIASKKAGGEMNTKFGLEQKEQDGSDLTIKESKAEAPSEVQEEVLNEKKKRVDEIEEVADKQKKKSNFEEQPIEGYYKGKAKKKGEELADEGKERSGYKEEEIETYYKGETKQSTVQEEVRKSRSKKEKTDEEQLEELKQKVKISVEEDISQEDRDKIAELEATIKKKKKAKLTVEASPEEKKTRDPGEAEVLGGHYKGKIAKKLHVDEDNEDFVDEDDSFEDLQEELKKKTRLEIENDLSLDDFIDTKEENEGDGYKKPKIKLNVEEEKEDADFIDEKEVEEKPKKDPKIKLDVEDESPLFKERQKKDEEVKEAREAKVKLTVEKELEEMEAKKESDEESQSIRKPKVKLTVEKSQEDFTDKKENDNDNKGQDLKGTKTKLNIEDNTENEKRLAEAQEKEEKDNSRKGAIVNPTANDPKKKSENQTDELSGNMSRKSLDSIKDEKKDSHNRADARADHIKTHYSSKESLKHNDDDWGDKWKKKEKVPEEFKKKAEERELIIDKKDLGEQTIDYKKLKEQFESISFDGIANKKKIYGAQIEKEPEIRTFQKTIYHEDGTTEEITVEEIVEENEDSRKQIFVPNPEGLDVATQILSFYMMKETKPKQILAEIGDRIYNQYTAQTAFYFFNKATGKYDESYAFAEHSETFKAKDDYPSQIEYWRNLKDVEFNSWQFVKLPFWSDTTFRNKEIQFVYPLFEGVQPMGFAVVAFQNGMTEEKTKTIEMIIETARGFYLDLYHEVSGTKKDYGKKAAKKDSTKEEKKGGMMKKLFGWAS